MLEAGVDAGSIYEDQASVSRDNLSWLTACLKALRPDDVLVVWKLDRLGRSLTHLVNTVKDHNDRGVGLRVFAGHGAQIDTTAPTGRPVFGIFVTVAEFERDLMRNRIIGALAAAHARGCEGG